MKHLKLIILSIILLGISTNSIAYLNYKFINKRDSSYANVKRGMVVVSVPGNTVPNERELRNISSDAWKKYKGSWDIGSVLTYVKNMDPTSDLAYAVAEYKYNNSLSKFYIQDYALEISQLDQPQKKIERPSSFQEINYSNLKNHSKYKLSKKTPLMPEPNPNPKNVTKAIKKIIYLEPADVIQVVGDESIKNNLWYKVFAYKHNGTFVGFGWINSIALIGQKIEKN